MKARAPQAEDSLSHGSLSVSQQPGRSLSTARLKSKESKPSNSGPEGWQTPLLRRQGLLLFWVSSRLHRWVFVSRSVIPEHSVKIASLRVHKLLPFNIRRTHHQIVERGSWAERLKRDVVAVHTFVWLTDLTCKEISDRRSGVLRVALSKELYSP